MIRFRPERTAENSRWLAERNHRNGVQFVFQALKGRQTSVIYRPFRAWRSFLPSFPVVSQSLTTGYFLLRLQRKKTCVETNAVKVALI
jgi:hypothetical protein